MPQDAHEPGAAAFGRSGGVAAHSATGGGPLHQARRSPADELERARGALAFVDPREHDTWLKVGMALKSEFGDVAWPMFDQWSRPAENYNARENRSRWRSFKPDGGVTIATLYHLARQGGWREDALTRTPSASRSRAPAPREGSKPPTAGNAAEAANKASVLWAQASEISGDNPYCRRKGINPDPGLREIEAGDAAALLGSRLTSKNGELQGRIVVVPIERDGKLSSLQLIDGDGSKHFMAGGAVGGGFWSVQAMPEAQGAAPTLLIAEGVATALSARAATGHAAVAAMMNSNLPAVARQLRANHPTAVIIILADLDKKSGEPDRFAVEAANAIAAKLAVPAFERGRVKDFNDMAVQCGLDAVRSAIVNAIRPDRAAQEEGTAARPRVELITASSIVPTPIAWIWQGHLARGKVHILGGKPASGKTTLALSMAATITRGAAWPDGTRCKPGEVVIWSGEDDPADTLVPRLIAAGADLSRVHFVSAVNDGKEAVPFDPAAHMPALMTRICTIPDLALLIVDPVVSAVAGDSNKNAEVRRALQPLAELAAQTGCAVLGITHFTKGTAGRDPVERLTGSLAFGALARVVLVAVKEEDSKDPGTAGATGDDRRILLRAKSNIGPDGGGFQYSFEQCGLPDHPDFFASVVRWGAAVVGSARELLANAEGEQAADQGSSLSEAMGWLEDLLDGGPLEQKQVKAEAVRAGQAWATVRRAKKRIGVKARKQGMQGGWVWELPEKCSEEEQDAQA